MKQTTCAAFACAWAVLAPATAATITFDDLPPGAEGYWNGSDESGGFTSGGATFHNAYDTTWGSWSGFAYSNHTDTATPGWGNQYSAIGGGGAGGSANYAVAFDPGPFGSPPTVTFAAPVDLAGLGALITNTTYAALAVRDGEPPARQFSAGDWFLLTITGFDTTGDTGTVEFYLADFRDGREEIVDDWTFVDFSTLGVVGGLRFSVSSSDVGDFGVNTPTYFAMDDFLAVPEPSVALTALAGLGLFLRRRRN